MAQNSVVGTRSPCGSGRFSIYGPRRHWPRPVWWPRVREIHALISVEGLVPDVCRCTNKVREWSRNREGLVSKCSLHHRGTQAKSLALGPQCKTTFDDNGITGVQSADDLDLIVGSDTHSYFALDEASSCR